jgi:hypothetical protein
LLDHVFARDSEGFEAAGSKPAVEFVARGGVMWIDDRDTEHAALGAKQTEAISERGGHRGCPGIVGTAQCPTPIGEVLDDARKRGIQRRAGIGAISPPAKLINSAGVIAE